jgi:hypothetical protein
VSGDHHKVTEHKWTLALHQALVRDVVSLITSDTPSLKEVGDMLKGTDVWLRVFKTPFSPPGEWIDMHPPLVLEMLETAEKLGEVRNVQHALNDLTEAEQWQQYTFEELRFRYDFYTQHLDRSLSRYYTPYSKPLK